MHMLIEGGKARVFLGRGPGGGGGGAHGPCAPSGGLLQYVPISHCVMHSVSGIYTKYS